MSNNDTEVPRVNLNLVSEDKEAQLHSYLGKIVLFPDDIQDKIIDEISMLPICTKEAVNNIIAYYTDIENTSLESNKMPKINKFNKK